VFFLSLLSLATLLALFRERHEINAAVETEAAAASGGGGGGEPRLVVMGAARDVESESGATVAAIRRAAEQFDLVKVLVFENDSVDGTREALAGWQEELGVAVEVVSERNVEGSRTEVLARARNELWRRARAMPREPEYVGSPRPAPPPSPPHERAVKPRTMPPALAAALSLSHLTPPFPFRSYVLMLDLDGVNSELSGVASCLDLPAGWAACGANQRDTYYDLWALRTFDEWCPCDVFFDCPQVISLFPTLYLYFV